jgi:hypothetical protein
MRDKIWVTTAEAPYPNGRLLGIFLSEEDAQDSLIGRIKAISDLFGDRGSREARYEFPYINELHTGLLRAEYPTVEVILSKEGKVTSRSIAFRKSASPSSGKKLPGKGTFHGVGSSFQEARMNALAARDAALAEATPPPVGASLDSVLDILNSIPWTPSEFLPEIPPSTLPFLGEDDEED